MNKQTEALELALEAIEACLSAGTEAEDQDASDKLCDAYTAIRKALAEQPAQQQEPVAKVDYKQRDGFRWLNSFGWQRIPDGASLYTSPPASKPWVGLTPEDKAEIEKIVGITEDDDGWMVSQMFTLTEAKLKEKNNG